MRYMGGKFRLAKQITAFINRSEYSIYLEPFVGGASVLAQVTKPRRFASDIHGDLIALYKAIQAGWIPPDKVSQDFYELYRQNPDVLDGDRALRAFIGFSVGFGGSYFDSYSKGIEPNGRVREYVKEAKEKLLSLRGAISTVVFLNLDYREFSGVKNCVIYLDPPYSGATTYKGTPPFDSQLFWKFAKYLSKSNSVFVSEYVAPIGIKEIARWERATSLAKNKKNNKRIERLFYLGNEAQFLNP